jgi:hypothetical protein
MFRWSNPIDSVQSSSDVGNRGNVTVAFRGSALPVADRLCQREHATAVANETGCRTAAWSVGRSQHKETLGKLSPPRVLSGDPPRIRTLNLLIKSQLLCQIELAGPTNHLLYYALPSPVNYQHAPPLAGLDPLPPHSDQTRAANRWPAFPLTLM